MTKGVAISITYKAVIASTGAPVDNDQARHTLKIYNGKAATTPNHAATVTSVGNGQYGIDIDGSEITADAWKLDGTSSTSGVVIIPASFDTSAPSLRYVNDSTHNDPA